MKGFSSITAIIAITSISQVIATPILKRQLATSNTENDLKNGSPCKAVTVIFARGTTEAGNVGSIAGPPFFAALAGDIGSGNLAVQGVDYSASIGGFLVGGGSNGEQDHGKLGQSSDDSVSSDEGGDEWLQVCSVIAWGKVLISFSQGGQLVHNAASMLSSSVSAKINSVVIFGDPDNGKAVGSIPSSNVLVICHTGDDICLGGDLVLPPHLTYGQDAGRAASFVAKKAGF